MDNFEEYEDFMSELPADTASSTEKKQNRALWITIIIIILLIVILGGLFGFGVINLQDDSKNQAAAVAALEGDNIDFSAITNQNNQIGAGSTGPVFFNEVRFPVFSDLNIFDHEGKRTTCGDETAWVTSKVEATRAPLKATLQKMFTPDFALGFKPGRIGNIAAKQEGLTFEEVRIEDKIAKVYLTGELSDEEDGCDTSRLVLQIQEATLQFDTVTSVQIFLNGEFI